jgi:hypothetical protein
MPAREIAAIAAGERSGPKSADRDTLPITVIDIAWYTRHTRIFEGKPKWPLPRRFGNTIQTPCGGECGKANHECQDMYR